MTRSQLRVVSLFVVSLLSASSASARPQTTQTCDPINPCNGTPAAQVPFVKCVPDAYPGDSWDVSFGAGLVDVPAHYVLQAPTPQACRGSHPLLILFRGSEQVGGTVADCGICPGACYQTSQHWTPMLNSNLANEASARGWYVMSPVSVPHPPTGGYPRNLGTPQGILNTRLAVEEVLNNHPDINRNRIYAVGFSEGGCNALAYSARNLDPEGPYGMIAGLALLAGTTSNSYWWNISAGAAGIIQEALALDTTLPFGSCSHPGSPASVPLAYQASSGVFTGCGSTSLPADFDRSLARNLFHIPVRSVVHADDMTPGLRPQIDLLVDVMTNPLDPHPDFFFNELASGGPPCPGLNGHCWNLYKYVDFAPANSLLEFFEQSAYSLCNVMPTSARVLVPEDTVDPMGLRQDLRYFYFRVTRHDPNDLGDFHWSIANNTLTVSDVVNVKRLRIRTETSCDDCHDQANCSNCYKSGIDPAQAVFVEFNGSLNQSLNVLLEGYPNPPTTIARQLNGGQWIYVVPSWIPNLWNQTNQTVKLTENSLGPNDTARWWIQ